MVRLMVRLWDAERRSISKATCVIISWLMSLFLFVPCLFFLASHAQTSDEQFDHYGRAECMASSSHISTYRDSAVTLLPDALKRAAWTDGSVKAIMLSSCDYHCLIALLPMFLIFLNKPLDNQPSLTKHFVLVSFGEEAHDICQGHALAYGNLAHQCLLDLTVENNTCWPKPPSGIANMPDDHPRAQMGFKKMRYFLSLLQKIRWALLTARLGYSVIWVDLDVVIYRSPFSFFSNLPKDSSDMVVMSELWTPAAEFSGSTCLIGQRFEGCKDKKQGDSDLTSSFCCDYSPNGGLWFAQASPGGVQLLEEWLALYYIHGVTVDKKAFGPEAPLDQDTLLDVIRNRERFKTDPIPLFRYSGSSYAEAGHLNCSLPSSVRIISGYVATSHCWTGGNQKPCGLYRNTQFGEGCRNPGSYQPVDGTWEPGLSRLLCKLPSGHYENLLAYHHTCLHGLHLKQSFMKMRVNMSFTS
jgi:hypothetical protein